MRCSIQCKTLAQVDFLQCLIHFYSCALPLS
uniref:Uncharacterized protein n=1 Tax=Arundo donax TaxID=35708 RepID=A0A0A9ADW9_ARUDO